MNGSFAPFPASLSRRHLLAGALGSGLSGCGLRERLETQARAFTDLQIPSGLPPEYYPPRGFVWSGLTVGNGPQARYGVAAPPVNPMAHMLILTDAAHPAEASFDLAQTFYGAGISVWLYEPPGQGGAGRYALQNGQVDMPDFRAGLKGATTLITDIIRPSATRPLWVLGLGSGAVTALMLEGVPVARLCVYGLWDTPQAASADIWSGDSLPEDAVGRIAHRWQKANPDLRLRGVTRRWLRENDKARHKALARRSVPPVDWFEGPETIDRARTSCERRKDCQVIEAADRQALKTALLQRLMNR